MVKPLLALPACRLSRHLQLILLRHAPYQGGWLGFEDCFHMYIYIYFTDFNGSGHIGNLYYSLILPSECIGRFKQVSNETSNLVVKGRGVPFKFSILGSLANSNGLCVYSEIQWSTMWTSCAPNKLQLPKSAFVAISVATIVATWSRSTGFPLAALAYDVWCLPTGSWKFNT